MKKYIYLAAALLSLSLASCEDVMDDINKKPDNPANDMINPALQLTDGIMSTGYTTVSGNLAWGASSLTEQLVGVGMNQFYDLEIRNVSQTASSSTYNNEWNGTYYNIYNLKLAVAKSEEGGAYSEYVDVRGMSKVLLALNFGVLTDLFGDIPCSEATENTQPKVDKQQDVYTTIFSYLDGAIADLESAKADGVAFAGSQDILYNGDLDKWIAFAYALNTTSTSWLSTRMPQARLSPRLRRPKISDSRERKSQASHPTLRRTATRGLLSGATATTTPRRRPLPT